MNFFQVNTIANNICQIVTKVSITVIILSLSACTFLKPTGPAVEILGTSDPKGPGVFSGETGEFSVSDFFDPEKRNKNRSRDITVTGSDVDIPAIDLDSFEEFERFKAWRRAQEVGSIEYQDWLEYQDFLRQKAKQ